jgi:hypothetical protein
MEETLIALILLSLLRLFLGRHWYDRTPSKAGAFCAWCIHRDGYLYTRPQSSVGQGQACGPACVGRLPGRVRQERDR